MAEAFDGSQNLVSRLGPFEGLRIFVVQVDEGTDVGLELFDRGVNTSLDLLSGEFSEPAWALQNEVPTDSGSSPANGLWPYWVYSHVSNRPTQ